MVIKSFIKKKSKEQEKAKRGKIRNSNNLCIKMLAISLQCGLKIPWPTLY